MTLDSVLKFECRPTHSIATASLEDMQEALFSHSGPSGATVSAVSCEATGHLEPHLRQAEITSIGPPHRYVFPNPQDPFRLV